MDVRLAAAVVMSCCALTSRADAAAPSWVVDPAIPGPDLPAEGRSLFDSIAADGLPFPFAELVKKIERQAGCRPGQCVSSVLIPLGRSLQRPSAAPDFFASPRVVVAVTGEGTGPLFAKDRLYLGYQERANLIEVISYNEDEGRFEFQLVRDYRAGGSAQPLYASRAVCVACHQNQAPIFARQVWGETNANPRIAAALAAANGNAAVIHGTPVHRGVEVPNSIDDATDRANLFFATQRMWREACDSACRAQALIAALQYRLSGDRAFEVVPPIAAGFGSRWPHGLAIPSPDVPNRDPLALGPHAVGMAQVDIPGALEALKPRPPLMAWNSADPLLAGRLVAGLAAQIADADVRELDSALQRSATSARRRHYTARCSIDAGRYDCSGEVALRGDAATIEELTIAGKPLRQLRLNNGSVTQGGLRARTASGDAIERVTLGRSGSVATVTVVEDFAVTRAAIARADWPAAPFSRERMRAVLGLKPPARCCAAGHLPPARDDTEPARPLPAEAEAFVGLCARCHRTPESTPPNFLSGDAERVSASLAQCAPRIFVRLAMWQTPEPERAKVPMPPPLASEQGAPRIQTRPDPAIAALQAAVSARLRAESGQAPDVSAMLARGYEALRPCLPPAK